MNCLSCVCFKILRDLRISKSLWQLMKTEVFLVDCALHLHTVEKPVSPYTLKQNISRTSSPTNVQNVKRIVGPEKHFKITSIITIVLKIIDLEQKRFSLTFFCLLRCRGSWRFWKIYCQKWGKQIYLWNMF